MQPEAIPSTSKQSIIHPIDTPELIELLISDSVGTHKENFITKLSAILKKTPKIGVTTNSEFFPHFFAGSFLSLLHTQLMQKLAIQSLYIKPISDKTFKVVAQIQNDQQKQLKCYSFTTAQTIEEQQYVTPAEFSELTAEMGISHTELANYQITGELFQVDKEFNVRNENYNNKLGLDEAATYSSTKKKFKKINQVTEQVKTASNEYKKTPLPNLESFFLPLAGTNEREVEEGAKSIFEQLTKIYQAHSKILKHSEAANHGFSYGVLEMLFKYRYALDICVERLQGKGRADLLFLSRLDTTDNKNWLAFPVVVEFKAHASPDSAIQQAKEKGYLYRIPSMRTLVGQGILLGVNFAYKPNEAVKTILTKVKIHSINFPETLWGSDEEAIRLGLEHLYYSIVESNGAQDNAYYLYRLILGQLMGSTSKEFSSYAFIYNAEKITEQGPERRSGQQSINEVTVDINQQISTFLLKKGNELLLLNIGKVESFSTQQLSVQQLREVGIKVADNAQYKQINIHVKPNNAKHGFYIEGDVDKSYYQEIKITTKQVVKSLQNPLHTGRFEPIKTTSLLSNDRNKPINENSVRALAGALLPLKPLITAENDSQALLQGLLMAEEMTLNSNEWIRVYTEANVSSQGKMDIVVSRIRRFNGQIKEGRIVSMELKYEKEGEQKASETQQQGIEQNRGYATRSFKTFTDRGTIDLVTLTFDANADDVNKLILFNCEKADVFHSSRRVSQESNSDLDWGRNSQQAAVVNSPWSSSDSDRTVINSPTWSQESLSPLKRSGQFSPGIDPEKTPINSPDSAVLSEVEIFSENQPPTVKTSKKRKKKQSSCGSKVSRSKRNVSIARGLSVLSREMRRRNRRNIDSCLEYSLGEDEEEKEVIEELLGERKRGEVILIADDYALLTLASLREEEPGSGKLIVISESPEPLEVMLTVLGLVKDFQDVDDWLQIVKKDFPKEGALLETNKHLIYFSELKAVLASEQKPLFKVISRFINGENLAFSLGIDTNSVAAIYLGDNQLLSESWYSSLSSDSVNTPSLYRKSLLKPKTIEKHQGSLAYFRALHRVWERKKNHSNNLMLKDTLVSLGLAESFFLSANQALEEAGLGDEKIWMPLLDSIGKLEGRSSGLVFLNLQTYETRTLDVDIEPIREFQTYLRELHEAINPHFVFEHEGKTVRHSRVIEQAEAVDGLNSAFLLQTLLAWSKQKDRTDLNGLSQKAGNTRLSQWIEIHNYIGLAQMGHGVISDVNKVVSLVKTLLSEEQVAVKSTLSGFRSGLNAFFNEGLGILFGVANVVMDSGELSEAKMQAEKDVFSTQLTFDVGQLSLSLGAGGASMVGATTTAGVLGALAVPVVGLNIGITGLVKAFEEVVTNAQAVGIYFYQLDNAYRQLGYQKQVTAKNNSLMSPLYGAVIKEINFQTNTLHYGDSYLYSSQTKTGSGKSNYIFWAGYFPKVIMDKKKAFSIRERLNYPKVERMTRSSNSLTELFLMDEAHQTEIDKHITTWILPSTPESYISYSWKNLPFATTRHDKGFLVLRQLEAQEDFHYDFYIFPSEYIVSAITPEFIKTAIKIVLDGSERTLIIPQFSSQQRFIAQYLHYTLASPKTAGKTILHLGEVGSLKLESCHASYNWELVCNNCSNPNGIQFTDTGIKIYGIAVEVLNPSLGNYYLHLDNVTYKLDIVGKQVIPLEMDAAGDRNNTHLINNYLEDNVNRTFQNLLIKIDNYPMQNNQGETYNGTAFYSTAEDRYFYTDGLPDKAILAPYKKINSTDEVPTSLQINFIGRIGDLCYFWAPYNYFWSSDQNTHEIVRKYHISDKEIIAASIVADHSVQIETVLNIYSKDALLSGDATDYFERHITYFVKPDGELYLTSLSDSNDHLLHLFENNKGKVLVSNKNINHIVGESWEIRRHFHEQDLNSFIVAEGWEVRAHSHEEDSASESVQQRFAHRLNQFVSILPGSQNISYTPLWIRAQNETYYQLINSGIQEKNLLCLGALTMKNGTEVLYFYKPSDAPITHDKTISQSKSTGKLFLKSHEEVPAKALDLSLLSAFRSQEKIFVVTTEQLIEELDAFGKSYLTAITADWIKAHPNNWWTEISTLASNRLTETTETISIYGLQDQSGQALGAWYNDKRQSFSFTQPPLNEQSKQLPIRYLTSQGIFDFFFCAENGILYQAKSSTSSVHESFNDTQLKVKLPDLVPFVTSLKTISLQNKRWILETQGGEIVSSRFFPANHWTLEKIGQNCYNQCAIDNSSFPERTRYGDNNIQRSLLNLDSIFNKNCFDAKRKPISSSRLVNNTLASFCSIDNFKRITSWQENDPCLSVNPNQAVPVLHFWWLPKPGNYFYNIYHKATHSWEYLGLCKQTATQNGLGACFFSQEDRMIYFAPEGSRGNIQGSWNLLNKHKTRMQAEFVQKQGKSHFLLVINADRPSDSEYANEHFMPLLTEIKTIGLLLENTTPDFPYKIHKEMLVHYEKVLFYQSHGSQNTRLYFPVLKKGRQFIAQKKGSDIVLKFPYFHSQCIFVNAMEANSFNKTEFSFENAEIEGKVLETGNGSHVIDARSSYYEAIETIRQVFLQRTEENLTLRYKIAVEGSQAQHYQSARLTLEQPEVKIQQNLAGMNKVFWQTNYLWWTLSAGTMTFFSAMALVASVRYWFIRWQDPARENAIPLVTMVATAAALTPLLPEAQAYEKSTVKKLTTHSGFSEEHDCIKSETLIGLLGICVNEKRVIYWQQTKKHSIISLENYFINYTENNTHYLDPINKEEWEWKLHLDIDKIEPVPSNVMQRRIPTHLYEKLVEQKKQQEILIFFRQQIAIAWGHYLVNGLALYTQIGDLFQAVGLAPNWQARDDIHFLSRCWITISQLLSQQTFSEKLLSFSVALSEIALLHPRIQSTYAYLTNNSDFSKAKAVIRFIGDLLQLGLYNFSYLARLLEFCFPNNESVWKLSLGIRMVSHFYLLTDDLSYWYLGMALFVLPYVPILLEHLGVSVTRGLHEVFHKLSQMFVVQSLLNHLSEDTGRMAQRDLELMQADERVEQGRERLKNFTSSHFHFFQKNKSRYPFSANDEIERAKFAVD